MVRGAPAPQPSAAPLTSLGLLAAIQTGVRGMFQLQAASESKKYMLLAAEISLRAPLESMFLGMPGICSKKTSEFRALGVGQ